MSLAALNMHGAAFKRILRYQYYQDTNGVMELRILPGEGFGERDIDELRGAFARKVGGELDVRPVVVDNIPLTGRGKLKRLVQMIPPPKRCGGASNCQDNAS